MNPLLSKLPPGADVVFRRLFDEENGCRLLISLLNAILRYAKGHRISRLTLLRSHLLGPLADDKEVILDVRAEAEDGRKFHIEVQVSLHPSYAERVLLYWSGIYSGQLESGKGYRDLRPVISVHILFSTLFKDPQHAAYHHVIRARADGDNAVLSPHFEIHTIEMTKFPDVKEGELEAKWLYWLKHGQEMTAEEVKQLGVPEIVEAERKLAMISQDRQLRVEYERRRMAHHDAVSLRRDSWLEGRDEGKRLGLDSARQTIMELCAAFGIDLSTERREHLQTMQLEELDALRHHIIQERIWPQE